MWPPGQATLWGTPRTSTNKDRQPPASGCAHRWAGRCSQVAHAAHLVSSPWRWVGTVSMSQTREH